MTASTADLPSYIWQADNLQQATQGVWHKLGDTVIQATAITTDTRKIGAGDVFLAIKGERFDAHDFVKTAQENGVVALIV